MQAVAEDVVGNIVEATKSVFNTMVSIDLDSGTSFYKDERPIGADIMALVSFAGEHNGTISIFCSAGISLKIASNMLGMPMKEINDDVKDAVGEVVNMIAGNVKTGLAETFGEMSLTIPLVITGDSLSITAAGKDYEVVIASSLSCKSNDAWLMTPFKLEGEVFHVGLIFKKAT
ncbi:MAG: chemotaxis protein CheX [Candidatus Brocadiales bacterium]